jgi:hypothetical protein
VWQDRLQAREPYEGLGIGFDGGRDGITITVLLRENAAEGRGERSEG